ncbi:nitrite reductase [Flammeovirgaceae bacterium SG7u.111]|nr:nitrite reductase [Flammeovirgaceae bacterium SG7u.132]WPO35313.1 nitrite reductase [Flammeovirgaceae bacterium SG7u.111]
MDFLNNENLSQDVKDDILELTNKISAFKKGQIPEERFKAFRLTRGVYGQRQAGVQMYRTKIPYGKLTTTQLIRLADVAKEYTNANLHATTRQNFQMHYIHLEDSVEVWEKLEETGVTAREACGNTVRNVTASANAGVDPEELFDVSSYAHATFEYFLRNAVCQDMGRKIKIAFSSSDRDAAFAYIHDFGFIPRIKDGVRGFKVLVGGGLGAQAFIAPTAFEFMPANEIIPFMEAGLRVFDRYGEREKRHKARMKFLIEPKKGLGLEKFLELVEIERKGLASQTVEIDPDLVKQPEPAPEKEIPEVEILDQAKYDLWLKTNVFEQKQKGWYGVNISLPVGNISSGKAKQLAKLVTDYAADDIRITMTQGLMLKYVRKEALPFLFYSLNHLELAEPGFETIADVTACPGTDTCNLGVTNSTGIATELENVIKAEYPDIITDSDINIKISGCMNSCGQHMSAQIGLHGSSIKNGKLIVPAMQVVLGGGVDDQGKGFIADKVIKLPTKRIPDALRSLLDDFDANGEEGEYFNDYYKRQGKMYFYGLLKPLADLSTLKDDEYKDWGQNDEYIQEIGVGECASVSYDMVGTIINDAEEKLYFANKALGKDKLPDAIYYSYSSFVVSAKALLLSKDVNCNTHNKIISDFDEQFVQTGEFDLPTDFTSLVLQVNKNEPSLDFAKSYMAQARTFLDNVLKFRKEQLGSEESDEKLVVSNFYKA